MTALGITDTAQAFARIVFNVLACNVDDHTKNHAFLMTPDGTWSLAPAYDLTYTDTPDQRHTTRHLMAVNGKLDHITKADLLALADKFAEPGARHVIARVTDAVSDWQRHASAAGVPAHVAAEAEARLTDRHVTT